VGSPEEIGQYGIAQQRVLLSPTPISVLYPRSRQLSSRVRIFTDWLVEVVALKL
jgi:DNA-binding transcriptional LysR family regulator